MLSHFVERLHAVEAAARNACDPGDALAIGRLFGSLAFMNDAGVYADDALVRSFAERFPSSDTSRSAPDREIVHVISDAYRFGGHTRLMERLAAAHVPPADVVITRSTQVAFARERPGLFATITDLSRLRSVERLEQLTRELARHRIVVLHNSEDDFVAAVAAWRARQRGSSVLLMNHADHHFSFGREVAETILEVGPQGHSLTKRHLPGKPSFHVGIPLSGPRREMEPAPPKLGSIHLLSGGAGWKYRPELGLSLMPVIEQLLEARPQLTVSIIGVRRRDRWWWPLKLRHPWRVHLSRVLPYERYMRTLASAHVLLDSFPVPGGTAFPEAIWTGKFTCALQSPLAGLTPADTLRVPGVRELIEILDRPAAHRERLVQCQALLEEVHGMPAVQRRYLAALEGRGAPPDAFASFDTTFLSRAWEARGRIELPSPRAVEGVVARALMSKVFPPYARELSPIGRARSAAALLGGMTSG
jgi:hypothetical protein